jgi:hypothetical protein
VHEGDAEHRHEGDERQVLDGGFLHAPAFSRNSWCPLARSGNDLQSETRSERDPSHLTWSTWPIRPFLFEFKLVKVRVF